MAIVAGQAPPWGEFFVTGDDEPAEIRLRQVDSKLFALESSFRYRGATDVKVANDDELTVTPKSLPSTDLTSVPKALRWFVSPYGIHTPAALLHDRLVGEEAPEGFDRVKADRLFRDMLECLGVPFLRRWLMWAAVAFGTRWSVKGTSQVRMILWALLAVAGMTMLVVGVATTTPLLIVAAAVLPVPSALLWGKQFFGGLVAAASGPWLFPPAILATIGYGIYWVIEKLLSMLPGFGRRPARPREF